MEFDQYLWCLSQILTDFQNLWEFGSNTTDFGQIPMVSYSTFFQANATKRMQTQQNWSRIGKISQSNANAGQMSRTGFSVNCTNEGPMLELLTNALLSITNQASL